MKFLSNNLYYKLHKQFYKFLNKPSHWEPLGNKLFEPLNKRMKLDYPLRKKFSKQLELPLDDKLFWQLKIPIIDILQ